MLELFSYLIKTICSTDMFKGKNTIIFDFDGTLADTWDIHAAAWTTTLKKLKKTAETSRITELLDKGFSSFDIGRTLFSNKRLAKKAAQNKRTLFNKSFKKNARIFLQAERLIKELFKKNYNLIILTSHSSGALRNLIKRNGLEKYFCLILEAPFIDKRNLNKKKLIEILRKNGIEHKKSVYVGDSSCDLDFSRRAGIPCILIKNDHINKKALNGADYVATRLKEIATLFPKKDTTLDKGLPLIKKEIKRLSSLQKKVVVGISGATASGKSFIASEIKAPVLALDNYYKDGRILKKEKIDFYEPPSLYLNRACHDIKKWLKGGQARVPVYDIKNYRRAGFRILPKSNVLIIDGLFALLNPLTPLIDLGIFVDCAAAERLNRKIRRALIEKRSRDAKNTKKRFKTVVEPTYKKYIDIQKRQASIIINNNAKIRHLS